MAKLLKLRRGTTSQHSSFTGAEGEVTVDTDKETIVVHDGSTAGGHPLALESANLSLIDEDNMATNSNSRPPSQQSVKAYVDAKVPTSITVADESSDTTCFPLFVTAATGDLAPKTGSNFTFNSSTGKVVIGGDLQVQGTTTTVDSTTMTVADKNIEIAKGAANDAAADGAGITVDSGDGDKTWNWVDATDAWTSSEHIHLGDSKQLKFGSDTDCYLWHDGSNAYVRNTTGSFLLEAKSGENAFVAIPDGAVTLYHDGSARIATSAAGVTVTGTVTDDKGNVRTIPQLSKSSKHTIVLADAGKHSINSSGGWELDTSTAFTAGMAITLINNSGSDQTIEADGVTLYNTADAATGNRTLAGRGMATVICTASNTYYISGAGLS